MAEKERIQRLNNLLVEKLESFDSSINVYADSISEDEQNSTGMKYFLYSTGDFGNPEGDSVKYTMVQSVFVTFVSVERPFIDGDIFDIIKLIRSANHAVIQVEKNHGQIEKQDMYVDVIVVECRRLIKIGC